MVSCTNNKGSHKSFLPSSPEPLSLFSFVFYSEIYEERALVTAHRSDKASRNPLEVQPAANKEAADTAGDGHNRTR